jgi:hypothetical protein
MSRPRTRPAKNGNSMKFCHFSSLQIFLIVNVCFDNFICLSAFHSTSFHVYSSLTHTKGRESAPKSLFVKGPFKDAFDFYGQRYDEVKVQVRNKLQVYLQSSLPVSSEKTHESASRDEERTVDSEKEGSDMKKLEVENVRRKLAAIQPMIPQFEKFIDEYTE